MMAARVAGGKGGKGAKTSRGGTGCVRVARRVREARVVKKVKEARVVRVNSDLSHSGKWIDDEFIYMICIHRQLKSTCMHLNLPLNCELGHSVLSYVLTYLI